MASPLDFEFRRPGPSKRRKKLIGLDDLLSDFYKEDGKHVEVVASKRRKNNRKGDSDEEDNAREANSSSTLDEYHKQMKEMGGEDEVAQWDLRAFGVRKSVPTVDPPEPSSCALLQSLKGDKSISLLQFGKDEGMYALKEELRSSAYQFWFENLSAKNEDNRRKIKIDWLPNYSERRVALGSYGFMFFSSDLELAILSSSCTGPPCKTRTWIKFVSACCKVRSKWPIFSALEAEVLTQIIICLLLDRQLEGLYMLLHECLSSLINYFTDEEWIISCKKNQLPAVPKDLNCLRAVECIPEKRGQGPKPSYMSSSSLYQQIKRAEVCLSSKML